MIKFERKNDKSGTSTTFQEPVIKREEPEKQPPAYVKVSNFQIQYQRRSKKRGLDQISNVVGERERDDESLLDRLAIDDDIDFNDDF